MKKLLFILSAISILSAPVALAGHDEGEEGGKGHKGKHHGKMFKKMDENKDGVVSKEEMVDGAKKRFDKMDSNADGKVTKDEAKAMKKHMKEKRKEHKEKRH